MAEATLAVTAGSGSLLHVWTRTISANTVIDQFTLPGEFPYATYSAMPSSSVSIATANDHIIQLMAGSSLNVKIRRIRLEQAANATTASLVAIQILRLTTAGSGGTAVTPGKFDTSDAASGATAMTLPSSKGTESTLLMRTVLLMRQAISATQSQLDDAYEWVQQPGEKPLIIPAGTSNGIALKTEAAIAGCTVIPYIEFVEQSF